MDTLELPALKPDKDGVTLPIRVKPRGRKNAIEGVRDERLLVSVSSAPTDGEANAAVVATLAHALRLPKSGVQILHGHKSREKTVRISGLLEAELRERLNKLLDGVTGSPSSSETL